MAAGYSDVATADAAVALSAKNIQRISETSSLTPDTVPDSIDLGNFDPVAAGAVGVRMSFANMLIQARKPAPERIFDLTDPAGNTPHLARDVKAMKASVPEISTAQMSQVRRDILTAAYMGLGHHYVWGGTSFSAGWDCSGFVQWAYAQAGIGLPRTEQWLPMVETSSPQPGDLVVQNPDGPNHWSHIGIYIGNGQMISALNPSVGTILHTPAAVSSSSAYFTMPAFAAADELAAKNAKESTKATATTQPAQATATASPSTSATPSTKATNSPSSTPAATTKPGTSPATKPATKPATSPATTAPETTKPTPTAPPATTKPATTAPAPTTEPPSTAPATTKAPTVAPPATTAPSNPEPTTAPASSMKPSATATESPTATEAAQSTAATEEEAVRTKSAASTSSVSETGSPTTAPATAPSTVAKTAPSTATPSQ